jgi:Mrp family chromosome partitioning ATPase
MSAKGTDPLMERSAHPRTEQPSTHVADPTPTGPAPGGQFTPEPFERPNPGVLLSVWRHRWLVLLATIAGVLAGLIFAQLQSPVYEASALMRLADPLTAGVFESQEATGAEVYMARRQDLVRSRAVTERAAEILGPGISAGDVRNSMTVGADDDLLTLTVRVEWNSASGAANMADTVAEAYQQVALERTRQEAEKELSELRSAEAALQERIESIEEELDDLPPAAPGLEEDPRSGVITARLENLVGQLIEVETRIREVAINAEVVGSGVEMFESATVPTTPVEPRPGMLALLGGAIAAAFAIAFAYWRTGQVSQVWSSTDVERILAAPLLARLPVVRQGRIERLPDDLVLEPRVTEAYQFLLNSVEYELGRIGGSSILITSAGPTQGKTSACIHLALAAGKARERNIVLVDGDLRARYLTRLLDGEEAPGLSELVTDETGLEKVLLRRAIADDVSVWAVPAGERASDPSFLRSPALQEVMSRIRHAADLTILDSAPVLAVADTTVIAAHVDAVVLMVNERTPAADLERVRERLSFVSAPLLGYVFVSDRAAELDHYGYGYGTSSSTSVPLRERTAHLLRRSLPTWITREDAGGQPPAERDVPRQPAKRP